MCYVLRGVRDLDKTLQDPCRVAGTAKCGGSGLGEEPIFLEGDGTSKNNP